MHSPGSQMQRIVLFLAVLIGVSLIDRALAAAPEVLSEPHDFVQLNRPCKQCHVRVGVTKQGGMRKTVGTICAECHRMGHMLHPVEIKPSFNIPADMPLDAKGLLTCATCHNIHKSRYDPATGEQTMYLRRKGSPQEFCESCHGNGIWPTDQKTVRGGT